MVNIGCKYKKEGLLYKYAFQFFLFSSFSFLSAQKRNKKRRPKTITPRFRYGSLIKLLYYCGFCSRMFIAGINLE